MIHGHVVSVPGQRCGPVRRRGPERRMMWPPRGSAGRRECMGVLPRVCVWRLICVQLYGFACVCLLVWLRVRACAPACVEMWLSTFVEMWLRVCM